MDAELAGGAGEVLAGVLCGEIGNWLVMGSARTRLRPHLLGSFTDVITNLKPFASVPQPSVTYFRVTKFVRVRSALTVFFVFRQEMSICNQSIHKLVFAGLSSITVTSVRRMQMGAMIYVPSNCRPKAEEFGYDYSWLICGLVLGRE